MFRKHICAQVDRVRNCPQAAMLGEKVYAKLEDLLGRAAETVTGSAVTRMIARTAASDDPFVAAHPELLTEEERTRARDEIKRQLDSGAMPLPEPLEECLTQKLENITDGFLETLTRVAQNRDAICAALTGGRLYRTIEDVTLSVGDTHNRGRSVTILRTDAGKIVYKPHDMRADEQIYMLAGRFFNDFVGIPRSVAFGESFGVCEFIEKRRAEGEEEAERFWYSFGGLTAFVKLLGSTDLHFENILCIGAKPYIVDLETALSPVFAAREAFIRSAGPGDSKEYMLRSPGSSLIMPSRINDMEISALTNLEESGIAPLVDGKRVSVRNYLSAYKEGYRAAYTGIIERREDIAGSVKSFPPLAVRIVLRSTRGYCDVLKKLYHHTAMTSPEGRKKSIETLSLLLRESDKAMEPEVINSEVRQMERGDVPYFYTYTDSLSLYGDGEELAKGKFGTSAAGHILDTLYAMDESDLLFDLAYIERAIGQYPERLGVRDKETRVPRKGAQLSLSTDAAAAEAGKILGEMYDLRINIPGGRPIWGYVNHISESFSVSDTGLFDGFAGLAVFASACAAVSGDRQSRNIADELIGEAADEIRDMCRFLENNKQLWDALPVGEASGLGGILTGLALIRRYSPDKVHGALCENIIALLEKTDFSCCREPDRIGGLAGLVSAMCRFEEYSGYVHIIRAAADRLLELKDFKYRDALVWKTMTGIPRAISGAGHGMAGIAEALFAAADTLGDDRYVSAAGDALDYELSAYLRYSDKFGTWADLRDFPPESYMHGYCAGAPGIGIMLSRIIKKDRGGDTAEALAGHARESVDKLPLNICDHLCCGNAAIAEYYLSVGDREAAGRVLGAMLERRQREGSYRYSFYTMNNSVTASLFNGMCGVGYEMLRFAFPERVLSVL